MVARMWAPLRLHIAPDRAVQIADRQFGEDIVKDRGSNLMLSLPLHHASGLRNLVKVKASTNSSRHTIGQARTDMAWPKLIHHCAGNRHPLCACRLKIRPRLCRSVYSPVPDKLCARHNWLLGIAFTALRHLLAVCDLIDPYDHLLHNLSPER